jgi:cell division protein FtsB
MKPLAERWLEAGTTHSQALSSCEDDVERMRCLATAPLFSLWVETKDELVKAAAEIERLRAENRAMKSRIAALEGEDA